MGAMSLARAAAKDERIEAVVLDSCFASAPLLVRQHLGRIPLVGPVLATLIPAAASLRLTRGVITDATATILSHPDWNVCNSFAEPDLLVPRSHTVRSSMGSCDVHLPQMAVVQIEAQVEGW